VEPDFVGEHIRESAGIPQRTGGYAFPLAWCTSWRMTRSGAGTCALRCQYCCSSQGPNSARRRRSALMRAPRRANAARPTGG
jgi:hypothetical protein